MTLHLVNNFAQNLVPNFNFSPLANKIKVTLKDYYLAFTQKQTFFFKLCWRGVLCKVRVLGWNGFENVVIFKPGFRFLKGS